MTVGTNTPKQNLKETNLKKTTTKKQKSIKKLLCYLKATKNQNRNKIK